MHSQWLCKPDSSMTVCQLGNKPVSSTFTVMKAGTLKALCCLSLHTWHNASVFRRLHRTSHCSGCLCYGMDGRWIFNNSYERIRMDSSNVLNESKDRKRRGESLWKSKTGRQRQRGEGDLSLWHSSNVFKNISISARHSNSALKRLCHLWQRQILHGFTF